MANSTKKYTKQEIAVLRAYMRALKSDRRKNPVSSFRWKKSHYGTPQEAARGVGEMMPEEGCNS